MQFVQIGNNSQGLLCTVLTSIANYIIKDIAGSSHSASKTDEVSLSARARRSWGNWKTSPEQAELVAYKRVRASHADSIDSQVVCCCVHDGEVIAI